VLGVGASATGAEVSHLSGTEEEVCGKRENLPSMGKPVFVYDKGRDLPTLASPVLVVSPGRQEDEKSSPHRQEDAKKSRERDSSDDADAEATTADTATPARLNTTETTDGSLRDVPADFGGSWLCIAVTGDMEAFLVDMGLPDSAREAASQARYGALRQVQNIAQAGDTFVVENILDKPVTMRFCVGEGRQRLTDQEGNPLLVDPRWDGEVLCVASRRESGELITNSRRYFEGPAMILELQSPNGTVVRRKFQRRFTSSQAPC